MIALGIKVKDKITGFTGIVIAECKWLNGCLRYYVQSQDLEKGKPIEPEWIDAPQLEIVAEAGAKPAKARTGGPQNDPKSPVG